MQEQGRYPVIFLSLKDIKNPSWHTWPRMLDFIRFYFAQIYVKYQYLADSDKVDENSKRLFQRIVHAEATEDELTYSLTGLMKMMYAHYGKKVILLIDEYDVPLANASYHDTTNKKLYSNDKSFVADYHENMVTLIKGFFGILKDNVESCVDDPNKARNNFGSTFLKSNPNLTPQKLKILS